MVKKKNKKKKQKKMYIAIGKILAIIIPLAGFYAYQYSIRPELKVNNIDAQLSKITKSEASRINFDFNFENTGNGKATKIKLYTAFLSWTMNPQKQIIFSPQDFVCTDIPDISGKEKSKITFFKDIKMEEFIKQTNMAEGMYCIALLHWGSDNFVFWGRTFENNMLIILIPAMKDNKMVFQIRRIKQLFTTHWFIKSDKPEIFKTIKGLKIEQLLYGDTARFD